MQFEPVVPQKAETETRIPGDRGSSPQPSNVSCHAVARCPVLQRLNTASERDDRTRTRVSVAVALRLCMHSCLDAAHRAIHCISPYDGFCTLFRHTRSRQTAFGCPPRCVHDTSSDKRRKSFCIVFRALRLLPTRSLASFVDSNLSRPEYQRLTIAFLARTASLFAGMGTEAGRHGQIL